MGRLRGSRNISVALWRRRCLVAAGCAVIAVGCWWRSADEYAGVRARKNAGGDADGDRRFVVTEKRIRVHEANAAAEGNAGDARWERLFRLVANAGREEAEERSIEALLTELAAEDPAAALALVDAVGARSRRLRWMAAAVEGWAARQPNAAVEWARERFGGDTDARDVAWEAIVRGAAAVDEIAAEKLLMRVNREFPAEAERRRRSFVESLGGAGRFEAALDFSLRAGRDARGDLLASVFARWTDARPEVAAMAALRCADAADRKTAWRAVVGTWAARDPAGLANYAVELRDETAAREAWAQALPGWLVADAAGFSGWLDEREPGVALDMGAAAIASFAPLVARRPEVAADWAACISDREARRRAQREVMEIWIRNDPASARRYADAERESISGGLP